jgi:hypothetical protein
MNFRKTNYKLKILKNTKKDIKYSTQHIINKDAKRLVPNLSCRNYFKKSPQNPLFIKTLNQFNLEKTKLKNSSSALFQSNDVDFVRNLNFDYLGQINENIMLRENLINSLHNNSNEEEEEKTEEDLLKENLSKNKNEAEKEQIQLPKLNTNTIKTLNKYKSYELIQSHKRKIKNEISEQLQKELINKLKNLRGEVNLKKTEKNEIFKKIKNIEKELDEIDLENYFSKEKYKRQIDDIVKKTMEDRKEEVIKNKAHAKLEAKKKKFIKAGNFMEIFGKGKVDNPSPINNNKDSNNINNNTPSKSSRTNLKNEAEKPIIETHNLINNFENNNFTDKNARKSLNKKSLEIFKINLLQTQRKKEFENFQNSQKEKVLNLKLDLKNLENALNKIDKDLETSRKEEKEIISKLMLFYKELLFKGKSLKKDGLVWIIKAIWYLGENVPMSFMPQFLDFESIDYLFKLAHKQLEIEYFSKKIREMKLNLKKDISIKYKDDIKKLNISNKVENENNNKYSSFDKRKLYSNMKKENNVLANENKKDVYRDLVKEFEEKNLQFEIMNLPEVNRINSVKKHVEKIRDDIIQLKKNEIKRISKCFIENNYEEKYHTNIETVLSALIGTDAKDTEMNKYNTHKKNYIAKLKKIRFFDHEHIRKILSK